MSLGSPTMPPRNEQGREAVSVLATAAVFVGGAVVLTFLIISGTQHPGPVLAIVAGGFSLLGLLMFLLRDRSDTADRSPLLHAFRRRKHSAEPTIVIKRRSDETGPAAGSNTPPAAEQVRDLRDHASTWVPNRTSGQPPR